MDRTLHPQNQEQIDELISERKNPCKNCLKLRIEKKSIQRSMNTMLNQTLSELEISKKECEELRQALEQQAKD